jgi:hypothetical protein
VTGYFCQAIPAAEEAGSDQSGSCSLAAAGPEGCKTMGRKVPLNLPDVPSHLRFLRMLNQVCFLPP